MGSCVGCTSSKKEQKYVEKLPQVPSYTSYDTFTVLPSIKKVEYNTVVKVPEKVTLPVLATVVVRLLDSSQRTIDCQGIVTIKQLKQLIYLKYPGDLLIQQTVLMHSGTAVKPGDTLSSVLGYGKAREFTQRKAELWEIQGVTADRYKTDEISLETGVARMKCGHYIGRQSMKNTVGFQLNTEGASEITCPHMIGGKLCRQKWELKQCALIAGISKN